MTSHRKEGRIAEVNFLNVREDALVQVERWVFARSTDISPK